MKALISFLTFLTSLLCCYSQTSMTGAPQMVAAQRSSFNDIISIGELIKSVKEGSVGIKKIAERSGYAFRGRYHDPELNDFGYCKSLTNINIPDSVTNIGDYAFSDCSSLTSINIPDSVTNIGKSAFWRCDNLPAKIKSDIIQRFGEEVFKL